MFVNTILKFLPNSTIFFASLIFDRVMASMCYAFNINVCQHNFQSSTKFLSFLRHSFSPELWPRCDMLSIFMFVSTNFKVLPNLYHFLRHSISPELWPRCVMLSVFRQKYGLDVLCFQYTCLSAQISKFYQISIIFCVTQFRQSYGLDVFSFQYSCLSAQISKFYQIYIIFCVTQFRQSYGLDALCFQYFARNTASMCYAFNIHVVSTNFKVLPNFYHFLRHSISPELWPRCVMLSIFMFVSTNFKVLPNLYHFFASLNFARVMASMRYAFSISPEIRPRCVMLSIYMFVSTNFKVLPNFYHFLRHSISPELWPRCVMLSVFRQKYGLDV